jgi:hypothetical protein
MAPQEARRSGMQRVKTDGGNAMWEIPIEQGSQPRISQYEAYRQLTEVARNEIPNLASGQVKSQLGSDGSAVTLKPNDVRTSKVTQQSDGSWQVQGTVTISLTPTDKKSFPWTARALGQGGEWNLSDVEIEPAS